MEDRINKLELEVKNIKSKFRRSSWISWIIALLAVIATLSTNWNRNRIAERTHSFNQPKIEVALGKYGIAENKNINLVLPYQMDTIVPFNRIATVPFSFINTSKKNLENVSIRFWYSEEQVVQPFSLRSIWRNKNYSDKYTKDTIEYADSKFVHTTEISKLQPNEGFKIQETFNIRNTINTNQDYMNYFLKVIPQEILVTVNADNMDGFNTKISLFLCDSELQTRIMNEKTTKEILFKKNANTYFASDPNKEILPNEQQTQKIVLYKYDDHQFERLNYYIE